MRLRRMGVALEWGAPDEQLGPRELLGLCRARGRSSVEIWRADEDPVDRARARRVVHRPGSVMASPGDSRRRRGERPRSCAAAPTARSGPVRGQLGIQARSGAASRPRTARSSTTGSRDGKAGRSESTSIRAASPPSSASCAGSGSVRSLPRSCSPSTTATGNCRTARSSTVDDGTADCERPLSNAETAPQLFVPTREVGGSATWLDGEPLLSWADLEELSGRGVRIGAHARTHRPLAGLEGDELTDEVGGSLADFGSGFPTVSRSSPTRTAAMTKRCGRRRSRRAFARVDDGEGPERDRDRCVVPAADRGPCGRRAGHCALESGDGRAAALAPMSLRRIDLRFAFPHEVRRAAVIGLDAWRGGLDEAGVELAIRTSASRLHRSSAQPMRSGSAPAPSCSRAAAARRSFDAPATRRRASSRFRASRRLTSCCRSSATPRSATR